MILTVNGWTMTWSYTVTAYSLARNRASVYLIDDVIACMAAGVSPHSAKMVSLSST